MTEDRPTLFEHRPLPQGQATIRRRDEAIHIDGCDLPLHLAMPMDGSMATGAILLVPHKHGLDLHSRELADSLASHGMVVVTADLLARLGGTERLQAGVHPSARGIPAIWHVEDLQAATGFLQDVANGLPLTVLGEAFGCELAVRAAREEERLRHVVTVYGPHEFTDPPPGQSLLAIYAEDDVQLQRASRARQVLSGWPDTHVVTVAHTHRPFLDHQRPETYEAAAAVAVVELIADWVTKRSS